MTSTATIVDPQSNCSANAELFRVRFSRFLDQSFVYSKHNPQSACLGCHWCALEFHVESDRHFIRRLRVRLANVVNALTTLHSLTLNMRRQQQQVLHGTAHCRPRSLCRVPQMGTSRCQVAAVADGALQHAGGCQASFPESFPDQDWQQVAAHSAVCPQERQILSCRWVLTSLKLV